MQAAVVHASGAPPRFEPFPDPVPGPEEVLVHVRAAGLHPVVKTLARGAHYGSTAELPFIPGLDGVGHLEDGSRVYCWMARPPYGTMAERTVASRSRCVPLPENLSESVAAAIVNPGMSAWGALSWQAQLVAGETVLVLGATGAAGQLAVQIAKCLGAGRVVAAGRNAQVLARLPDLGADGLIQLDQSDQAVTEAVAREAADGLHVIVDYLWGRPTEAVLAGIMRTGLTHAAPRVRLVQVGQSAGPTITLPAAILRSSGLEIYGYGAGTIPIDRTIQAVPEFLTRAARGEFRIGLEEVPLATVEDAWQRPAADGRRIVLVP